MPGGRVGGGPYLTARAREIHDELEGIAAGDDNRSRITFAEFMEALSHLRRIRTVIGPWMGMIEQDLDAIQRYYLAVGEGRCDGGLAGHPEVASALAYRLQRSRL